jgi:hypothetical protein
MFLNYGRVGKERDGKGLTIDVGVIIILALCARSLFTHDLKAKLLKPYQHSFIIPLTFAPKQPLHTMTETPVTCI